MTVGQSYLWAEVARQTFILKIRATNVFLRQTAAHRTPYALLILRGVLESNSFDVESTFVHGLNDLIFTVFGLIIWSVKYWTLIWIINEIMQMRLQYLEWLSIDTVQDSGITGPVEMDIVYDYRISIV